ncbi:MAG: acyl dehydratase [Rhodococcus sp.]|nr:acyl dehydratase [Rhodococcus sp. (in: high G+C Gram-positive bacteria)]
MFVSDQGNDALVDAASELQISSDVDSQVIGSVYPLPVIYQVSREKIREIAGAVQDAHRAHRSEAAAAELGYPSLVASPTFVAILAPLAQKYLFDTVLKGFDLSQVLQSDQRFVYHQPLLAGDEVRTDIIVEAVREIAGSTMFTIRNDFRDARDELVIQSWTTLVGRQGLDVDPELLEVVKGVTRVDAVIEK